MRDYLEIIVVLLTILAIAVGLALGLNVLIGQSSCKAMAADIGYPHLWSFWSGCMIEVNPGQWIPLENYRYFEE